MSETHHLDFAGHRLAYRVTGQGPALVVLNLYRRRDDAIQAQLLGDVAQVFQIFPLGYGYSERVPGYAGEALADQVLAVVDQHGVDRFIVWGYSKGGAMAACIARGTGRTAGLVCGAYSLLDRPSDASMRQMDRRLRADHPSRTLWAWVKRFDWAEELAAMACPALLYWAARTGARRKGYDALSSSSVRMTSSSSSTPASVMKRAGTRRSWLTWSFPPSLIGPLIDWGQHGSSPRPWGTERRIAIRPLGTPYVPSPGRGRTDGRRDRRGRGGRVWRLRVQGARR